MLYPRCTNSEWAGRLVVYVLIAGHAGWAGTANSAASGGRIPAEPWATSGVVTSDIVMPGTGTVAAGNAVTVTLLGLQHDWAGDLTVTLTYLDSTGKAMKTVDLLRRPGLDSAHPYGSAADFGNGRGLGDNFSFNSGYPGSLWAAATCADAPACTTRLGDADAIAGGLYFPSTGGGARTDLSSAFAGFEIAAGRWRLTLTDAAAPNRGSFVGWELSINTDSSSPPPPGLIVALAGAPQTALLGAAFGSALQVKVTDASANVVSGATVTFTSPASGASALFNGGNTATAVTNASGIAVSSIPAANNVAGTYTVSAAVAGLTPATFTLTNRAAAPAATAVFVKADIATQGNWRPLYGFDGYNVIGDAASYPSYVNPVIAGNGTYVWAGSTTEIRALRKVSNPADRIAGTWYFSQPLTMDLSFSDTAPHQVALYCLDWDSTARRQIIEVLDANGGVLNTQALSSSFNAGVYMVWNVSGHVLFRITVTGGGNGVVAGLFFDAAGGVMAVTGTPQTVPVGSVFSSALQAKVVDAPGAPVGGVTVTFTAPAAGASATFAGMAATTAVTNASGIATSPIPLANSVAGTYTVSASVPGLPAAAFTLTNTAATSGSTAIFVKSDSATKGNWRGVYGAEGYNVAGDLAGNPAYVNPVFSGNGTYTWTLSTADARALQKPSNPADRIAGTWFSSQPFTIDLHFTDTGQHPVALYCLDWDSTLRRQTVEVLDASGAVLNAQTLPSTFDGGVYLVWNVSGHVKFRIAVTAGPNGVVSGLFFGAAPAPSQSVAAFAGTPQTAPTGAAFASALQARVMDASSNPMNGVTVTFTAPASGASATFAGSPSATAVTNASGIAASPVPFANGWAGTYSVSAAVPGSTPAVFTLTNSAVTSGPTATFVKSDSATKGNWQNVYGLDGYLVAGDLASNPAYVTPVFAGNGTYTWAASATGLSALQKPSNPADRIAGAWYASQPFTIDLNFDTAQHQVALYCLDWDSAARRQTIDVLDGNGNVLNTQALTTSFNGGVYLIWNLSGHVKIRITATAGANGVLSGLFFR